MLDVAGLAQRRAALLAKARGAAQPPPLPIPVRASAETVKPVAPRPAQVFQKLRMASSPGVRSTMTDVERILGLPLEFPLDDKEADAFNRTYLLASAYQEGVRFLSAQPNGIIQYLNYEGAFLPIGVGHGKTVIGTVIADQCFKRSEDRILLFMPPALVPQYWNVDIRFIRSIYPLGIPFHNLHGETRKSRSRFATRRPRGLYIFPYSLLSAEDADDLIRGIDPTLIVADEAHSIANESAARTKRVVRYMRERSEQGRPVQFVAMSGTITAKHLKDYAHLAQWALRERCFLPLSKSEREDWSGCVDAESEWTPAGPSTLPSQKSSIYQLVPWARQVTGEAIEYSMTGIRRSYRVRMQLCPGVYSTGDASVGTSLIMSNKPVPDVERLAAPGWADLQKLMDQVEHAWLTPDGDEIDHAMHKFKWFNELSAGIYLSLRWPQETELARRRGCTLVEAQRLLERAKLYHQCEQAYHKGLREYLKHSVTGLDTPRLVGNEFYLHQDQRLPSDLYRLWEDRRLADFEGRPERDSVPVRVCPYKIVHAINLAKTLPKGEGCLIWVHNIELGVWTQELFKQAGIATVVCGGDERSHKYLTELQKTQDASQILIVSIGANKQGKNLQFMRHQIFLQWPRPARDAEQTLGRTHRNGQKADELDVWTCHTTQFDRELFAACINDALYIHQTTGTPQKLIYANYNPMPTLYSEQFLEERGYEPDKLDPATIRLRLAKFGDTTQTSSRL